MQENNDKNQGKNGLSFESLDILIAKWKDGTFSEIIDDWKWIFSYSVRYKWAIVFYTILGIFSTSMGLVSSVAGKYLIDIITGYKTNKLMILIIVMVGSSLFSLLFSSIISRISAKLSIYINNDIQADIFDKIVDADWLEINKYSNGDVLNRFNGDIGTVSSNAISWLPTIVIAIYNFIATFVVSSRGDANAYSNLSSANTMAKTFEKILKSNIMEKKICEKLKVEELDADIHAKVLEGTNMLVLSVTADTPKDSIDIIRTVMDNYSSVSLYTVGSAVMDVLEEPKVPYTPDNPLDAGGQAKKGGLVAGALVLILLGLFSYMKNTIKQENEIEKKLDARSLGAISYEWKYKTIRDIFRRKKKAILVDDPVASFRFVESYKKLAAKVEYRMAKNEQKVLVVTSVSENEGKSTVAANLAITLAEQSKRVLLVDGDIRRPSQFLIFGMEPKEENELGEYLKGNRALADVMVPCTRKHMLFMGGKNCYSSSTEMLNSDSFYKLMTACRKFVDYVIIDTPPAGIIGDAQIFAHCADAVMIVSKQNYMLAEDINEVMDAFRDKEGKVLGVVLNGVRSFSGLVDSPVGHYYGKYSKYGRYGNYGRSKGM